MANHKPFSTTKNKLATIWEQSQENSRNVSQYIKTVDTNFLSSQEFKRPTIVALFDNYFQDPNTFNPGDEFHIFFKDLPDWAIAMCHVGVSINTWDTTNSNSASFDITKAYTSEAQVQSAFNAHTLKDGQIYLQKYQYNSWWTKLADGYKFTFQPYFLISIFSGVSNFGYSYGPVPLWLNVKLSFLNEKNYNAIQSGK